MGKNDIDKIKKELDDLKSQIRYHDFRYYVQNAPEISDQSYDLLYRKLKDLEDKFPELKSPDSPTQRITAEPLKGFKTIEHKVPMLSMDNTYSEDELRDFDKRVKKNLQDNSVEYVVELKIDGVSVSIRYENGIFKSGATRGDGYRGEDVSQNLRTIKSIPLKLAFRNAAAVPSVLEVRGEVYIPKDRFLQINKQREQQSENLFTNPRNAAAGSLKLLDSSLVAQRGLDIFIWGIGEYHGIQLDKHSHSLEYFQKLGLKVNPHFYLCAGIDEVIQRCQEWAQKKPGLGYDIDGMVVKVNSFKMQRKLGSTSKAPRWLIAYKFPAQRARTRLKEIKVQVGRFGTLTPVAIVEPVNISGTVVTKASLHNEDQIERLGVRINDYILVEKAGEIIPQVVGVLKEMRTGKEKNFKMPQNCPVCGGRVKRTAEEVALRCLNRSCPAQVKNSVKLFASRDAMDIEGLGDALIDQLLEKKIIRDYAGIYYLKYEDISSLERMGDKSAQNLLASIEASKGRPLSRLIYALGIRHVGVHVAEILADKFESLEELIQSDFNSLSNINEIGPVIAGSIIEFFSISSNRKVIQKLKDAGVNLFQKKSLISSNLSGKSFVITGTLKNYSRKEIENTVKLNSGRVLSSVSSNVDFLLSGENPGSKYDKAKKLGIKIINENDFNKMINKRG
ncbi:MAG TPA: NAD-dependent DNA ligase LigA [Candidatus Omnitrophica bacterium]|nr:NAD-dependent DNA ligase LigA [Candidatus Omnitrophota bacterium]